MTPLDMLHIAYGLILLFALTPPVFSGSSFRSYQFWIVKKSTSPEGFPKAVLAQERVEFLLRWIVTLAIAYAPCRFLAIPLGQESWWFVAVALTLVASAWVRIPWALRQAEFIGHAAEVLRVPDRARSGYLIEEAARMQGRYGGLFKGMTVDEVAMAIRRRMPIARLLMIPLSWRLALDGKDR
jgi:hypothetical protein